MPTLNAKMLFLEILVIGTLDVNYQNVEAVQINGRCRPRPILAVAPHIVPVDRSEKGA